MRRREFLQSGAALTVIVALPRAAVADASFTPKPEAWRKFEITTRIEIGKPSGKAQAWLPLPTVAEPQWTEPLGNEWTTNAKSAVLKRDAKYGAQMLHVEWADGEPAPVVEVISRIETRDRAVDLSKKGAVPQLSDDERKLYTASTELMPTDGIVKATADKIVGWAFSDVEKARRIYEWIVDNTFRDPKTAGCGLGDIRYMLESNNLGGKCADINSLFVGLARAAGLPARDVYGLRVAPSLKGYRSLGLASDTATKAQHCRAEVYLTGFGWVPVDPADVRKVVLEEPPGNLAITDERVKEARQRLFGSWEMNWIAFNTAHDVRLPGSTRGPLPYFMYPQGETSKGRLDSLDPDNFRYSITVTEVVT
jgi:transglutaminase-like putative cysteine protease